MFGCCCNMTRSYNSWQSLCIQNTLDRIAALKYDTVLYFFCFCSMTRCYALAPVVTCHGTKFWLLRSMVLWSGCCCIMTRCYVLASAVEWHGALFWLLIKHDTVLCSGWCCTMTRCYILAVLLLETVLCSVCCVAKILFHISAATVAWQNVFFVLYAGGSGTEYYVLLRRCGCSLTQFFVLTTSHSAVFGLLLEPDRVLTMSWL
jgi:hypothetical protein